MMDVKVDDEVVIYNPSYAVGKGPPSRRS